MMLGSGDGDGGGRTMVMMKSRMILMLQSKYTNALHQTRFEGFFVAYVPPAAIPLL